MNTDDRRTCPCCAEEISAAAKICPRCRQWLTWRSFRHPVVTVLTAFVPMMVAFAWLAHVSLAKLDRTFNPRPFYAEMPGSLQVVQSRLNWVETKDGLRIFLTGTVTNQSSEAWHDVEFDCRFLDTNGVMVDAASARSYFTALPHDDAAFRAVIAPARATNDYASFKVSVGTARVAKGWF